MARFPGFHERRYVRFSRVLNIYGGVATKLGENFQLTS